MYLDNLWTRSALQTEALLCILDLVTDQQSLLLWGGGGSSTNDLNVSAAWPTRGGRKDEKLQLLLEAMHRSLSFWGGFFVSVCREFWVQGKHLSRFKVFDGASYFEQISAVGVFCHS